MPSLSNEKLVQEAPLPKIVSGNIVAPKGEAQSFSEAMLAGSLRDIAATQEVLTPVHLSKKDFNRRVILTIKTLQEWQNTAWVQELAGKLPEAIQITSLPNTNYSSSPEMFLSKKGFVTKLWRYTSFYIDPEEGKLVEKNITNKKRMVSLLLGGLDLNSIKAELLKLASANQVSIDKALNIPFPLDHNEQRTKDLDVQFKTPESTPIFKMTSEELRDLLKNHGTVYFKPRIYQGIGVFRVVSTRKETYLVETNCGEVADLFKEFPQTKFQKFFNLAKTAFQNALVIINEFRGLVSHPSQAIASAKIEFKNFNEMEECVRTICRQRSRYIAQAAIPMAKAGSRRYEFRIVVGKDCDTDKGAIKGHYAKSVAAGSVSGCIATGAIGVSTEYALKKIIANYDPSLNSKQLKLAVENAKNRMLDAIENTEIGVGSVCAVDLAPVWNPETKLLDWWLIEINTGKIGIRGMRSTPHLFQNCGGYDILY